MARVRLFATYRDAAGTAGFDTNATSIRELVGDIMTRFPSLYPEMFSTSGELRPLVKVLVNGRHIQFLDGIDTSIGDEDTVSIFPPIAGG